MRRLILRNFQSPGDIVMLTAAVRDLHLTYPDQFVTDVRTPCPELWEHNPYLTPIAEERARCRGHRLRVSAHPQEQRRAVSFHPRLHPAPERAAAGSRSSRRVPRRHAHLADREERGTRRSRKSRAARCRSGSSWPAASTTSRSNGGIHARFQQVVDHFRDRMLFVQVGEKRPRASAAAQRRRPARDDRSAPTGSARLSRAGRALPGHAADAPGGRGRDAAGHAAGTGRASSSPAAANRRTGKRIRTISSSTAPARSGAATVAAAGNRGSCRWATAMRKTRREHCCVDVVGTLPRCMDLITAGDVIRAIEVYFEGGAVSYLTPEERSIAASALARC